MTRIFRLPGPNKHDPSVEGWFESRFDELGALARQWFDVIRRCGDDIRAVIHDNQPTACVGDAAFAYVDAFTAHVNVGFFQAAELPDPAQLLEGRGKFMRHVKLKPDCAMDEAALTDLIEAAYDDINERLKVE